MNIRNKELYYLLLDFEGAKLIRDPLWNTIHLHPTLVPLLETRAMQRLCAITQLGPTSLVYPGTTHTRYAHSIGVYHIARLILLHLLKQDACPEIHFSQGLAFLAAALLHDLGHFPFAHSLKELDIPEHEELSARIIMSELAPILCAKNISPELTAAIISPQTHKGNDNDKMSLHIFSQLLSGPLDPDKLDYLGRDAFFAGVPYGVQDISHAIQQLEIDQEGNIGFLSMLPVENILFSKYLMYSSVYWHKKVRAATAMVKQSLYYALDKKIISADNLVSLNDYEFKMLCQKLDYPYMKPAQRVHEGKTFTLVAEDNFQQEYNALMDLNRRAEIAQKLASLFHFDFVVIDVPEQISFEIDTTSTTVFSRSIVDSFVNNIRKLRVFADIQEHKPQKTSNEISNKIIEEIKNCL